MKPTTAPIITQSFERLKRYCEAENYKGWDPYDGLSSKVFKALPFIRSNSYARLAWIQLFKRNPLNLRRLLLVPKERNAKGLGLFLTGYCNLYSIQPSEALLSKIKDLSQQLLQLQVKGYSGSCWGYYFDWQARAFFQPGNTPTVVATSFVADALFKAYAITGDPTVFESAVSSAQFVLKDLQRTYEQEALCFSYSPLDQTQVYNASLLGARLLSQVYAHTGDITLKETAEKAVKFVCQHQKEDGSWSYGTLPFHQWIDNFHTGFNLECIYEYQRYTGDRQFSAAIDKGFDFYIRTFFTEEGISKYYSHQTFPIDIHAPAQLIVTLCRLDRMPAHQALADKVLLWTIDHMQDKKGYFYYQKKKSISSKIPYMRWAQSWMFYAMTYYLRHQSTAL